jgi:hypothetical protein
MQIARYPVYLPPGYQPKISYVAHGTCGIY